MHKEKLKTGHYKSNHDNCDYYITFKYNSFYILRVGAQKFSWQNEEVAFAVEEKNILKNIYFGGFYLVEEIILEQETNKDKNYKEYSTRKSSSKLKTKDKNQTKLF